MNYYLVWISVLVCVLGFVMGERKSVPDEERRAAFWERAAQKNLHASLRLRKIEKMAKNVIIFLGDGMGIPTVTATRIYKGQRKNQSGEDELLSFDQFPFVSLSKTYGIDRMTSDSANTATAYLCGVKANYGTIGVDGRVLFQNCSSSLDPSTHVPSILQWAQEAGKWTGFVTTTRVTHATPAGLYAHTACRDWESATPSPSCTDIAHQLVHDVPGKDIRVIMGGGAKHFVPTTERDAFGQPGARNDSKNLIDAWVADKKSRDLQGQAISDVKELRQLNPDKVDYLLGVFSSDHMPYVADRVDLEQEYPSLAEMTAKAVQILSKNPNGFFLLVEGGSIDLAHHMNWAMKALVEGVEFDKAIQTALDMTDVEETLIVVTADHSHTFTLGGEYPLRGTNILGLGGVSDIDNKTFTTLGYHNGPGYKKDARDRNLTEEEAISKDFRMDTALPLAYETHGGEDVAVYAKGPMAHLFHGVHDQSYIPYVMGYAACVGPNKDLCNDAWSLTDFNPLMVAAKVIASVAFTYICNSHAL